MDDLYIFHVSAARPLLSLIRIYSSIS